MDRHRVIAVALGFMASAVLVGMLSGALGVAEAATVVALVAFLLGQYLLRHSARRALVYDHLPVQRPNGVRADAA